MTPGFWNTTRKPIIGLSPMDGVTDAPYRFIAAKYGKPSMTVTEFTSVEGISAGALRLLDDFQYDESERPVVAQLFGSDIEAFYKATLAVCALGFDGVDINMGCPAKKIAERGAGAALIREPEHAKKIVRSVQRAVADWNNGTTLEESGLPLELIEKIQAHIAGKNFERKELPVSIKTRIGYDQPIAVEWVSHLLETEPVAITVHGRTLKQLYTGFADWEAIAQAAARIHTTDTLALGNGDVESLEDAHRKIADYGLDGVLIGRASYGDPWVFTGEDVGPTQRLSVALEHAEYFWNCFPPQAFVRMRKHLLDYAKGFDGAKELRMELMRVSGIEEVRAILEPKIASQEYESLRHI